MDELKWLPELDAIVAAPDHHLSLLENDRVRVLESVVKPGDSTPLHTHCWPAVLYVLGTSHFVRKNAAGDVMFDSRPAGSLPDTGTAIWSGPLEPHFVTNIGESDIRVISVEIKSN